MLATRPIPTAPTPAGACRRLLRAGALVALARHALAEATGRAEREVRRGHGVANPHGLAPVVDMLARQAGRLDRIEAALATLAAAGAPAGAVAAACERVRWVGQVRGAGELEALTHEIERVARQAAAPGRDAALAEAAVVLTQRVQLLEGRAAALAEAWQRTADPDLAGRLRRELDDAVRALAIQARLRDRLDDLAGDATAAAPARAEALAAAGRALAATGTDALARVAAAVVIGM